MEEDLYCELHCGSALHSPICLPDMAVVAVGRGPTTEVISRKCSRRQVELIANYDQKEVTLKVVGKNPSIVGNEMLKRGSKYTLGSGGTFELIEGHRYHIFFGTSVSQYRNSSDDGSVPVKKMKMDDVEMDKTRELECSEYGTLIVCKYGSQRQCDKIAGFDLDSTIIETASGRKFATDHTDWKLMPRVESKLGELHRSGCRIVIFSNQGGIARGKPTKEDFMKKISSISIRLRVPLLVIAATNRDIYRKPCTGMWSHLLEHENGKIVPKLASSFYVGDAAGRFADWRKGAKKDFSCTDRKFASNIGIDFQTPEEFFLGFPKCAKYSFGDFDPRLCAVSDYKPQVHPANASLTHHQPEVVVFVGFPASGKTTFYHEVMKPHGYVHVNRDTLGSWQRCVNVCEQELKKQRKVVIDNTNPDVESRMRYVTSAQSCGVHVRCFQFMTTLDQAKHNNRFRELTTNTGKKKVTEIAYNTFKSRFVQPTTAEGFTEILKITLNASVEGEHADLYKRFLL